MLASMTLLAREQLVRFNPRILTQTQRSIALGVLTKPDRIETGEEEIWKQRVLNKDSGRYLRLGWFSVRLLDPRQLKENLTREEASAQEIAFFTSKTPWSSISMSSHNLGVPKLVNSLSNTLSDLISKR